MNQDIKKVTFDKSIRHIGSSSFLGCSNLTDAYIWNYNTTFGENSFRLCPASMVIHGWPGSTAEAFASENSFSFSSLGALSGECGDNATWMLETSTLNLVISGTGATWNYDYYFVQIDDAWMASHKK